MHRVIAFAGHEIEEFSTFYFNDEYLTLTTATDSNGDTYYKPTNATNKAGNTSTRYNDYVRIYLKDGGSGNSSAIQALIQAGVEWTQDHKLEGVAYAYIRLLSSMLMHFLTVSHRLPARLKERKSMIHAVIQQFGLTILPFAFVTT